MMTLATHTHSKIGYRPGLHSFLTESGPFAVAAANTRMAMVFTDATRPDNPIIFANDAFLALTGYEREGVLGQTFSFLMARSGNRADLAQVESAFAEAGGGSFDMHDKRRDGSLFWASVFTHPVVDDSGRLVEHFVSFVDMTDPKREAEHLRFLLDELNHRTQNTLATVQAIAVQTLRGACDPAVLENFEGRMLAIAKTHGLLGRHDWDAVTLGDVLGLALQRIEPDEHGAPRVSIAGDPVRLIPKSALTLSLVFHELAINALKHGSLSKAGGRVDVAWMPDPRPGKDGIVLDWKETGGPRVSRHRRNGFGSRMIEAALARDLGGEVALAYNAEGLVCRIAFTPAKAAYQ